MNHEQLAELLSGIAKSQNAILDAVDRAMPGFKTTHLAPVLNVAANIRLADPRLIDLPSRILSRMQGRVAADMGQIVADLDRLIDGAAVPASVAAPAPAPVAPRPAAAAPAPAPAPAPVAAALHPAPVAAPASAPAAVPAPMAPRPPAPAPAPVAAASAPAAPAPMRPAAPPPAPAPAPAAPAAAPMADDDPFSFLK